MSDLQRLAGNALVEVRRPAFLAGTASVEWKPYLSAFPREIDLGDLASLVESVVLKEDREASDGWLAPRVHYALRLTRREAADQALWRYLAVVAFPEYVRWRWGPSPEAERFVGSDSNQAFSRLWWMAELFRNGSDYAPVVLAFTRQDIPNNILRMTRVHHRPTTQGYLEALKKKDGGGLLSGRHCNALAKALNASAVTEQFDLLAPDQGLDPAARDAWVATSGSDVVAKYLEELPQGPADPQVDPKSVSAMKKRCAELLETAAVRGKTGATDSGADGGLQTPKTEGKVKKAGGAVKKPQQKGKKDRA